MKKTTQLLFVLVCLCLPMLVQAQKRDDSKYLAGAVPEIDGKVVFSKEFSIPGMSKDEIFERMHIEGIDSDEFNRKYLYNLGFGSRTMPDALETCRALHQLGCRLYVLTNGVSATQRRRLGASGLMPYLSDIFVSEEAGQPKPALAYFQYVFERIPEFEPSRALMVGDSLSSDMEGARRAGLDACWFNAKGLANGQNIPIRYEIAALPELIGIVEG